MKQGKTMKALATELKRQRENKRDFIANTNQLSIQTNSKGESNLTFSINNKPLTFGVTDNAHQQIAARLNIPTRYYDKMRTESPHLLDQTINAGLNKLPEPRLIRVLDNKVRAFLSNRYRIIDNLQLCAAIYPFIEATKCLSVESADVTPSHLFLKVVNKKLKAEISKGNFVHSGFLISNSEVGAGGLKADTLIFYPYSKNALILKDCFHKTNHIGRQFKNGNYEIFDNFADNNSIFSKLLNDIKVAINDTQTFSNIVDLLKHSKLIPIQKNIVKAVESLADNFSLSPNERGDILRQLFISEDFSRFGLINAVSAASKIANSYERATDLEHIAGEILALPSANLITVSQLNSTKSKKSA